MRQFSKLVAKIQILCRRSYAFERDCTLIVIDLYTDSFFHVYD